MCTSPAVGTSSPASSASSVVLPEPDAPRIAQASPGAISSDMSWRMVSVVAPVETCFVNPTAFTIGGQRSLDMKLRILRLLSLTAVGPAHAGRTILVVGDRRSGEYGLPPGSGC